MKTLQAFMLAAFAMLPTFGQAQTVNICDRTPQVRDEILLAIGANDCAAVTAGQLAAIEVLCFHDFDFGSTYCRSSYDRDPLATLKLSDFDGLTSLLGLLLDGNRLTTLPAGVFDKLTSLVVLGLNGNNLTALPAGAFD